MKKYLIILIFIILSSLLKAQVNLVPNPSFEQYSWYSIPNMCDTICNSLEWYSPTYGSPDYFSKNNVCVFYGGEIPLNYFGYQYPHSGKSYMGFISRYITSPVYNIGGYNNREYIQVKLLESLKAGVRYDVNFYVSFADSAPWAGNGISAYFSDEAITYYDSTGLYNLLPYTPQINVNGIISDKSNWSLVSGSFIANGGEQYITIGNFREDHQTDSLYVGGAIYMGVPFSYYYIDDVCVYPFDAPVYNANAGSNVSICADDSVQLGSAPHPEYSYSWYPSLGLSDTAIANPYASPTITITYYLKQKDFRFSETTSSITVFVEPCSYFNVYPSLASELIYLDYNKIEINNTHFLLYDICGRKVKDVILTETSAKQTLDISDLLSGIYLYYLKIDNGINYPGKIMVVNQGN